MINSKNYWLRNIDYLNKTVLIVLSLHLLDPLRIYYFTSEDTKIQILVSHVKVCKNMLSKTCLSYFMM